ncbi:MAG: FtsH protease activity modulator HflK [Deltaproteobacteria bacterium]|nr:FtsH protease activity modulator HflK [Deltaproteobacteria bacterium]
MAWDWEKLQKRQQAGGRGTAPPDLDQVMDRFRNLRSKFPGGSILIALVVVGWLLSGIYIVAPDQVGVVKRFGAMAYTTGPGPHYHLPYPIETVMKPAVTQVRRAEIGFRTVSRAQPARYQAVPQESLMLTGDENIVDIQFIVQYKIKDASAYLFNVYDPEQTVQDAGEASMRQVVGKSNIDEALTTGKFKLQQETKTLLQEVLDSYGAGLDVVTVQLQDVHPPQAVIEAFKDVASAKEDQNKFINDAEGYRNDILPKAKGKAAEIVNQSLGYRESKINYARGDASRFTQVLSEYEKAKEVTEKRLYLEAMEEVLKNSTKIIVGSEIGRQVLPLLPLGGTLPSSAPKGEEAK